MKKRLHLFSLMIACFAIFQAQAQTDPGTANLTHQWTFEDGTANDAITTNPANGTINGAGTITNGAYENTSTTAAANYISFPGSTIAINTYTSGITMEAWCSSYSTATNTAMLTYFGNTTTTVGDHSCFMTTSSPRAAITCYSTTAPYTYESKATSAVGTLNNASSQLALHHLVTVLRSDSILFYVDGVLHAKALMTLGSTSNSIANLSNTYAWLGRSGYSGDVAWIGKIYKYSLYNTALTTSNIQYLYLKGDKPFVPVTDQYYYIALATGGKVIGSNAGIPAQRSAEPNKNSQLFKFVSINPTLNTYYLLNAEGNYLTRNTDGSTMIYSATALAGQSEWLVEGNSVTAFRLQNPTNITQYSSSLNQYLGATALLDGSSLLYNQTTASGNTVFTALTPAQIQGTYMFDGTFETSSASNMTNNGGGPYGKWVTNNGATVGLYGNSRTLDASGWQNNGTKCFNLRFSSTTDVASAYNSISQKLYGLTVGKKYKYSFYYKNSSATTLAAVYATATANADSTAALRLGSKFVTLPTGSTATTQTALNGYITFTATADTAFVVYRKNTASDSYQFYIDDLTLTELNPEIITSTNFVSMDETLNTATFTVSGIDLSNNISITAPTGITASQTSLAPGASGVSITFTFDGTNTAKDYIVLTSGTVSKRIRVWATKNTNCFTKLYPALTNLIADPYLSSLSTFGGWGATGIVTDTTKVYCGSSCGSISGGSLDRVLTGLIKVNTAYRVRAMINATSTGLNLGVYGWSNGQSDYQVHPTVLNTWVPIEMTFTTGAVLGATQGLFFNNASGSYIDNWEMYAVPKVYPSSTSLTFLGAGTKKIAVRAESLSNDITITAPTGYTVSPSTLLSTVTGGTGDSIAITFNSTTSAGGYIYFTSGTVKDSIQVTGTVAPSILASLSSLALDNLNLTGSFIVNGGNLLSDITITAPTGITVSPVTIPMAAAGNVTVNVTYNGTTSNVSGNIVLTSGTTTANVSVTAGKNSDCFTQFHPTLTNMIPDPYLNSLSGFGGWGNKAVVSGEAYCGAKCVKFTATTNVYPTGAALDVTGIAWAANTKYRVRAKVKTVDGTFAFLANGTNPDFLVSVPMSGTNWIQIDTTFTTGASPASGFFTFNNVDGASTGKIAYIDNYELYNLSTIVTALDNVAAQQVLNVYNLGNQIVADFSLSQSSSVEFSVYSIQGMLLSKEKATFEAGKNRKVINTGLASGLYLVNAVIDGKSITRKVIK